MMRPAPSSFPEILRCCGYRSRRRDRWVGYCLELHLRTEGKSWEDLLERLVLSSSMTLARAAADRTGLPSGKAPLRMRLLYAYIALFHFLRPRRDLCLADLSTGLLLRESGT